MFHVKQFFPCFICFYQIKELSLQHEITKLKFDYGRKRNCIINK